MTGAKKCVSLTTAAAVIFISSVYVLFSGFFQFEPPAAESVPKLPSTRKVYSPKAIETETAESKTVPKSKKIAKVPLIGQEELPTGCETCSAAMLLNFYGYEISETEFADNYLIQQPFTYKSDGGYAPDPNSAFVGTPYSSSSFGAYAPVIAKSMNKYLSTKDYSAVCIEGESLSKLCEEYIANGQPVMVWATLNMAESYETVTWTVDYTDENAKYKKDSSFTWRANEHCLVLTGYDEDNYYFNDPWTNSRCSYSKDLVNTRYKELGMQAVVMKTDD